MLEAATKGGSSYILIIYVLVFGALYFFYLRPRSKRQKAARTVQKKVDVGERAQTIGGFVGTVTKMTDEFITLKTPDGIELDFIPSAIARRFDPVPVDETHDDTSQEGDQK
jgi:preprotein translocase subunit YajC